MAPSAKQSANRCSISGKGVGPLHDAAKVARSGVPTVMMFVQSLHGLSHNKIEDTKEEHLELCVKAFDALAQKTIAWIREKRG
jgi:N-carbamoyl-L-amino-acid hydrolase